MAILRKQKKERFTVIDNAIFYDYELSYKAKGLLCQMLSLPDGWEFSIEGLSKLSTDGESAVRSALTELKEAGYFHREQIRKDGKIAKIEYVISETKNLENLVVDFPQQENLKQENQGQLNTNVLITNPLKTKEIYTEFENLWSIYPKKQGKDRAYKSYEKARKSGTSSEEIEHGIHAYLNFVKENKIDMQYVKMGSTFFSQKAWQDDWTIRHPQKGNRRDLFARLYEEHKDDL